MAAPIRLADMTWMEFVQRVRQANAEGLSILLIEQMASRATTVTSRAYVLENGRVIMTGPSAEIAADPKVIEAYSGRAAQT